MTTSMKKNLLHLLAIVTGIFTFGTPPSLEASVVLSLDAPGENVVLTNTQPAASGNFQFSRGGSNQFGGIAFELDSAINFNAVTFYIGNVGTGAANASISLSVIKFAELPTVPDPSPTTTEVYSYTTEYSELMALPATLTVDRYITFSFSSEVSLEAGTYGILFEFANTGSQQNIAFRSAHADYKLNDVVNFRTFIPVDGDTTYHVGDAELYFSLQSIPEPSIALLTGTGILFATRMLKRNPTKK